MVHGAWRLAHGAWCVVRGTDQLAAEAFKCFANLYFLFSIKDQ
jgi:hypothetical protein